jgi:hypothetical protein
VDMRAPSCGAATARTGHRHNVVSGYALSSVAEK